MSENHCKTCGTPQKAGSIFCGYCGARIDLSGSKSIVICQNCGNKTGRQNRFCPTCGFQLTNLINPIHTRYNIPSNVSDGQRHHPERQLSTLEKLGFGMTALAMLEFYVIVFINLLALVPAFFLVSEVTNPSFEFSLFIPFRIRLFTIEGAYFLIYFLIIIVVIGGSFFILARNNGRQMMELLIHPFQNSKAIAKISNNHLLMVGQLFFALLFFNVLYVLILAAVGPLPTSPDLGGGQFSQTLFLLANASVYEELIVRVLFIGIPLLIIKGLQKRSLSKSHFKKYIGGGNIEIGKIELILVCISSVIFGLAHVYSGWGSWKFAQATLGGIILGYLYLRVGLHGSVALHFSIDYLAVVLLALESYNLLNQINIMAILGFGLLVTIVLWLVASAYYFMLYVFNTLRYIRNIDPS